MGSRLLFLALGAAAAAAVAVSRRRASLGDFVANGRRRGRTEELRRRIAQARVRLREDPAAAEQPE